MPIESLNFLLLFPWPPVQLRWDNNGGYRFTVGTQHVDIYERFYFKILVVILKY